MAVSEAAAGAGGPLAVAPVPADTSAAAVDDLVLITVEGEEFKVPPSLFAAMPDTMLGALFATRNAAFKRERALSFDKSAAAFKAILQFYRTGHLPLDAPPPGVTLRAWFQDLDFFMVEPPLPPGTSAEMAEEFRGHVQLVLEGIHSGKPGVLDRLKAGYIHAARFITPYYTMQPIEESLALRNFLSDWCGCAGAGASAGAALQAASVRYREWSHNASYAGSIIKGAERFLFVASEELQGRAGAARKGDAPLLETLHKVPAEAAVIAATLAANIYAASALLTHGRLAQHLIQRELAREGLHAKFGTTVWPEDVSSSSDLEAYPNPYEECTDIPGACIVKLWGAQLRGTGHTEPAVWKVPLTDADRKRLAASRITARRGVTYALIDVTALR
jgi:hypothetical protein